MNLQFFDESTILQSKKRFSSVLTPKSGRTEIVVNVRVFNTV